MGARATTFALVLLLVRSLSAQSLEPQPSGTLLLPGRLFFGLSGLPTGELLAPCEDQVLRVLDVHARVLTTWTAPARFAQPVTVAPSGPLQLISAPQISGRIDVLAYDAKTMQIAGHFAVSHAAVPTTPTVWDAGGRLYQGWKDGHLESWSTHGNLLWALNLGFEPGPLLNDETQGLFVTGPNQLTLVSHSGQVVRTWPIEGLARGILQTLSGALYLWTEQGLSYLDPGLTKLTVLVRSAGILGVTTDRQNKLVVTESDHWSRLSPLGARLSVTALPRPALSEAVIDDRGRLLIATEGGLEHWTYAGQFLGFLGTVAAVTAPLLTERGTLAWGAEDWNVHIWVGAKLPPYSWPEAGGGPRRAWSTTRPASLAVRTSNWSEQPEFGYFMQLASSGEDAKQQIVLRAFEEKAATGTLSSTWPFANLVLTKILRSGLTDLELDNYYVTNNWPANRLKAYQLLASIAGPEDRDELLAILDKEFDAVNLAQGVTALAGTGWDGDGRLMRMLATLQLRRPLEAVLGDALVESARSLWLAGGRSADPALVPLLTSLYQGEYPRSVRLKAQKFFQDLMDGI